MIKKIILGFCFFYLFRIKGLIHFVVLLRSLLQLYSQLWQHLDHILASQGIYLNKVKTLEFCSPVTLYYAVNGLFSEGDCQIEV